MLQVRLRDAVTPVHYTSVLLGGAQHGCPHHGPRQGRPEPGPGIWYPRPWNPREPFQYGYAVQLDTSHEKCP